MRGPSVFSSADRTSFPGFWGGPARCRLHRVSTVRWPRVVCTTAHAKTPQLLPCTRGAADASWQRERDLRNEISKMSLGFWRWRASFLLLGCCCYYCL